MTALLALLKRVPWLVWPLLAALLWGGIEHLRAGSLSLELAAEKANAQATIERTRATYAAEAASAASAALAETDRRLNAQRIATDEAESKAAQARSDALAADSASARLRKRFAALAATCGSARPADTAASAVREATPNPGDLLSDVLEKVADAAGRIALAADQSRIAGNACEASYNALR